MDTVTLQPVRRRDYTSISNLTHYGTHAPRRFVSLAARSRCEPTLTGLVSFRESRAHKRLFSSDRILGAEALAGERGCESSDSASGEGREEPVGQLVSAAVRVLFYRQQKPDGEIIEAFWLTDSPIAEVSSRVLYHRAKSRWEIENQWFNDAKNRHGLGHICHRHPKAGRDRRIPRPRRRRRRNGHPAAP